MFIHPRAILIALKLGTYIKRKLSHFVENRESFVPQNFCRLQYMETTYVTGSEKTGLIYTKYIYSCHGAYLLFCICYLNSVSFIGFSAYTYDEICIKIKTHDSELRGQEEAGHMRRMSVLFTRSTAMKLVNVLNKPP